MTKKGQENLVKGYSCGFLNLVFPNLGHLEYCAPQNDILKKILVENKAFHFSKRALRAGNAHNKWLKKPWVYITNKVNYTKLFKSVPYYIVRTHET